MNKLTCATCALWQAPPGAFIGDCILGVYYGRPTFDYGPCLYHSERGAADVQPRDYSGDRGMTFHEWQKKLKA